MAAMTRTVIRAISMDCFFVHLIPKQSCSKFSEILEDAANSWESEVDMVLARIPARISPAISTARNP